MALAGGFWLERSSPQAARAVRLAAPVVALVAAAIFWISPQTLARSGNDPLKFGDAIARRVPRTEAVPYLGTRYWGFANPILYYQERSLEPSALSAAGAVAVARSRSGVLLADRERVAELGAIAPVAEVFAFGDGVLLELR
jgi:hypothetical protein